MNVNLYCHEKLDNRQIEQDAEFLRIVDQVLIEGPDWTRSTGLTWMDNYCHTSDGENLLKYPPSSDSWGCCGERWQRYSDLIDHIEHHHYLYKTIVKNNEGEDLLLYPPYKYQCDTCNSQHFTFFAAITHFLKDHVDHQIVCHQCGKLHQVDCYHPHIYECNIVNSYIKIDGQQRN